jgi:trehalose-phosphatase
VVVSGRLRESLDTLLGEVPGIGLVAEHGGWTRATGAWQAMTEGNPQALEEVARELERIAARYQGAQVERKTWSATLHHRRVRESEKTELLVEASIRIEAWLSTHPEFERIEGAQVIEVRPVRLRKSIAVSSMREHLGPKGRLIALGDDLTDEDMFRALGIGDEPILVGHAQGRGTSAGSARAAPTTWWWPAAC